MLVELLKRICKCLTVFVMDCEANQIIVAAELDRLRAMLGPLDLPHGAEYAKFDYESIRNSGEWWGGSKKRTPWVRVGATVTVTWFLTFVCTHLVSTDREHEEAEL